MKYDGKLKLEIAVFGMTTEHNKELCIILKRMDQIDQNLRSEASSIIMGGIEKK